MKLAQFFSSFKNLIATIGFWDVVDILTVAAIIYLVLVFVRRTNSHNVVRGIVILLVVFALANLLNLKMVTFLLQRTLELGLLALVIIFQPELRRLLERMGCLRCPGLCYRRSPRYCHRAGRPEIRHSRQRDHGAQLGDVLRR